jgi:hypothetical protein
MATQWITQWMGQNKIQLNRVLEILASFHGQLNGWVGKQNPNPWGPTERSKYNRDNSDGLCIQLVSSFAIFIRSHSTISEITLAYAITPCSFFCALITLKLLFLSQHPHRATWASIWVWGARRCLSQCSVGRVETGFWDLFGESKLKLVCWLELASLVAELCYVYVIHSDVNRV